MKSKTFIQYEEEFFKVITIIYENSKVYRSVMYKSDNNDGKIHFRLNDVLRK